MPTTRASFLDTNPHITTRPATPRPAPTKATDWLNRSPWLARIKGFGQGVVEDPTLPLKVGALAGLATSGLSIPAQMALAGAAQGAVSGGKLLAGTVDAPTPGEAALETGTAALTAGIPGAGKPVAQGIRAVKRGITSRIPSWLLAARGLSPRGVAADVATSEPVLRTLERFSETAAQPVGTTFRRVREGLTPGTPLREVEEEAGRRAARLRQAAGIRVSQPGPPVRMGGSVQPPEPPSLHTLYEIGDRPRPAMLPEARALLTPGSPQARAMEELREATLGTLRTGRSTPPPVLSEADRLWVTNQMREAQGLAPLPGRAAVPSPLVRPPREDMPASLRQLIDAPPTEVGTAPIRDAFGNPIPAPEPILLTPEAVPPGRPPLPSSLPPGALPHPLSEIPEAAPFWASRPALTKYALEHPELRGTTAGEALNLRIRQLSGLEKTLGEIEARTGVRNWRGR